MSQPHLETVEGWCDSPATISDHGRTWPVKCIQEEGHDGPHTMSAYWGRCAICGDFADECDHADPVATHQASPVTQYQNRNGKTVYRYELTASTLGDATAQIPGDFLVVWHYRHDWRPEYVVEVVRTF